VIDDTLLEAEEKMEKAVVVAKEEFGTIRTGRAHPSMFGKITAEYYGTQTPVNQLASFHIPEPRMVIVQPFDKSSMAAIEKAIRANAEAAGVAARLNVDTAAVGAVGRSGRWCAADPDRRGDRARRRAVKDPCPVA